ncbi:MAG: DNA-protecting protein DprA [Patescibacteria group bacterium]|jgi:DNA processing protein|nr:DNA-protecting protein DprA [Patescibacteria group bacterium]
MNIQDITYKSNSFPELLRSISSPPKKLYCLGEIPDLPMIAIVGTRRPSSYGEQITYRLAYDLASAGICLVSGLAYGIDAIAHKAAIDAKGKVVAVLGTPLNTIYPAANRNLAKSILSAGGAIISEYEVGQSTQRFNFPARNRIIAGLSIATIITEADAKSGSLITANFAINNDRMVMAVPGNITNPRSAGPNNLIKLGAKLVTNATDVLAELDLKSSALKTAKTLPASQEEAQIIGLIEEGHNTMQTIIDNSNFDAPQLAHILSLMEITGKIRNLGAGQWIVN